MGAQWFSNQNSSTALCQLPFLQLHAGSGYFPVTGESECYVILEVLFSFFSSQPPSWGVTEFIISVSRPGKSWNSSKGQGKSWKSNNYAF